MLSLLLPLTLLAAVRGSLTDDPRPPAEPYVEIDLSPVPKEVGHRWKLELRVSTTDQKIVYEDICDLPERFDREAHADCFRQGMQKVGFRAELVDKVKVRVYGCDKNGVFYPVVGGEVKSKDLDKKKLPKVTVYPEKKA